MDRIYINALTKSYSALKEQFEKGDYEENYENCFYAIGTMLHWLLDIVERLWDDKSKYSEFRFINNQLKHNPKIIELHAITGGLVFPEEGIAFGIINDDGEVVPEFVFPEYELIWKKIYDADLDSRYKTDNNFKNQYKAYQQKLQNKNIFETLTSAYEAIIWEYKNN